jgi:hypothetical protein
MTNVYSEEFYENKKDNSDYYWYVRAYKGKFIDSWKNDIYNDWCFSIEETLELILDHKSNNNLKVLVTRHKET